MVTDEVESHLLDLINSTLSALSMSSEQLRVTTRQPTFERWLGRRLGSSVGGAYAYLSGEDAHLVLINLKRIDLRQPRAMEIVVVEELIHMRDRLDGDHRRHAKHGYDRIAMRVAKMTGASLEEVRSCLIPPRRRPYRYLYECATCGATVRRRRTGLWSCGRCAPRFDRRHVLFLAHEISNAHDDGETSLT
ncbi:MAG: hypothetical protein ACRDJH_13675 [Thermomicrobiales bacterium]